MADQKPETPEPESIPLDGFEKVWDKECSVCGAIPVVKVTGMCGPCTWGEAETIGGNW